MDVLVLCDDFWHPAEVVELGLAPLSKQGFSFTLIKNAQDILTPAFLAPFPVILCCKSNHKNAHSREIPWFTDQAEVGVAEFTEYVRAGGGFLAVHSGNTARPGEAYAGLVGNHFLGHPPRCNVAVKITADQPVTRGVSDFTIRDEHYEIAVTDPAAEIFCLTTSASGGEQVGGYSRRLGQGRLCVLTPGHILSVWQQQQMQKLLVNALHYCAGKD